jgi:hypothetical protein
VGEQPFWAIICDMARHHLSSAMSNEKEGIIDAPQKLYRQWLTTAGA